MTGLAELLADCDACGIRLLPAGDGGLTVDAPQGVLTPDLMERLKARKGELLALLEPMTPIPVPSDTDAPATSAKPVCRCGSTRWHNVPIHNGQSIRRDCGKCGRFIEFPVWHGKDTLQYEQ